METSLSSRRSPGLATFGPLEVVLLLRFVFDNFTAIKVVGASFLGVFYQ